MLLPKLSLVFVLAWLGLRSVRHAAQLRRLDAATGAWRVQAPSSSCPAGCPCQVLVDVEQSWPAA